MKNPVKIPAARILKESGLKVPAHLKRDMLALIDKISDDREQLAIEGTVDEYDRREADPILDHAPAVRSKVDADRLLRLLDDLASEDAQ